MTNTISPLFDASKWREVEDFNFTDITYHRAIEHGTVRIAVRVASDAATPRISAEVEMMPSLAPKTIARNQPTR